MKNGTALRALSEELNDYSAQHGALDFYQQPIPAEPDERLDQVLERFMTADAEGRELFQSALTPASRALFGIYGHRAATRAVRDARQELLLPGLVASVIANFVVPDNRRVEIGLAVYHHAAVMLGVSPPELFANAANYAGEELATQLEAFGNRADVSLKKFGWKEVQSQDGIQYKYNWK